MGCDKHFEMKLCDLKGVGLCLIGALEDENLLESVSAWTRWLLRVRKDLRFIA